MMNGEEMLFELFTPEPLGKFKLDDEIHEINPICVGKLAKIIELQKLIKKDDDETWEPGEDSISAMVSIILLVCPSLTLEKINRLDADSLFKLFEAVSGLLNDREEARARELSASPT
jgi:hypothetical protein